MASASLASWLTALLISVGSANAAAATDKLPRLANGHPDFSGIWQTTSAADFDLEAHGTRKDAPPGPGIVEGNVIPYLPKALAMKPWSLIRLCIRDPSPSPFPRASTPLRTSQMAEI